MSEKIVRRRCSENIDFSLENAVQLTVQFWPPSCRKVYSVDRETLGRSSAVLRELFSTKTTGETELSSLHPLDFKIYLNWLYTGTLGTIASHPGREYCDLVDGYILGLKLQDFAYCDAMLDGIRAKAEEPPSHGEPCLPRVWCIKKAFEVIPELANDKGEAIQGVLVNVYARADDPQRVDQTLKDYEPDMRAAFTRALIGKLMETRCQVGSAQAQQHASGEEGSSDQEAARKRLREE